MNWIQINGKRSTLIRGLFISSLPPITKPQMRTQTDVIDGRDGDIITPLGYSAYDKPVQVGLHGDFDIDEVIAFFNSSGTVIFSNEPTKYYRFTVVEKVDFNRLVRFRTATVNFHVQPFKYSAVDKAYTDETTSGFSIPDFREKKNGLTVEAVDNKITFSGTATIPTEVFIPINPFTLYTGFRTVFAGTENSSGAGAISARLTKDTPANANTFGGSALTLSDSADPVAISENVTGSRYLNTLYFYVQPGTAISTEVSFSLLGILSRSYVVTNDGNYYALPRITVTGRGTVTFRVNGGETFTISYGVVDEDTITVDAETMDAYTGTTHRNRIVSGDYEKLRLEPGENVIAFTGDVYGFSIENYSRWL